MPSDVRRSARGAPPTTKPPPPGHSSSSTSLSSTRRDGSAKSAGAQKSATPHSLSSEDPSDAPRRSQRSHPSRAEEDGKVNEEPEDDVGDEEEITRCICGQQEYPGPPLSEAFNAADAQSEDAGGLFISCDGCSVWQHGGCVGIVEEAQVPDKYYCEECKPKQHELHTDSKGQSYSLYQPVYSKLHRKGSLSKHSDKAQKERENTASRASTDPQTGKRRATMRSKEHDDEEEQMRQAIEESKRDVDTGHGRRNGKRGREDVEDGKHSIKRQRTESESVIANARRAASEDESESDPTTLNASKVKKARAEAAQTARQAEVREKEKEREKARTEAAGRRQERAGRRRAEDELADETPRPNSARTSPPPSSQPASPPHAAPEKISHKRGAGKKVKKLGNNQYTKLREQGLLPSSPHGKKRQLAKDAHGTISSGDEQVPNGETHTSNSTSKNSPDHPNGKVVGKFGKGKKNNLNGVNGANHKAGWENGERTFTSMSRSIEAMSRSIAAAQLEMAGSWTPPASQKGGAVQAPTSEPIGTLDGTADAGGGKGAGGANGVVGGTITLGEDGKAPEGISAMEMADWVSRGINEWQSRFGHLV